ncbi:hypothetical protein IAT38_002387 [Cryptococcus sp. DSM 104549]
MAGTNTKREDTAFLPGGFVDSTTFTNIPLQQAAATWNQAKGWFKLPYCRTNKFLITRLYEAASTTPFIIRRWGELTWLRLFANPVERYDLGPGKP